ncbi:hypothetical protein [Streptomyces sp. ISL-11]|uniref:hypothetical protein n=1 Tax=Streptomyces sp. ISL-11 TaxID=2819174 RepID=UPI001BE9AFFA|nr:hypothetical protein [Streptomyces sp. ISL-11]
MTTAPGHALDRLERDGFDLVALGRALLADSDRAAKTLGGRTDRIGPFDAAALGTPY